MDYTRIITIEPGKRSGKPCIRGLRITVYDVLQNLANGMTHADILSEFPYLKEEDIRACLAFAADRERKLEMLKVKLLFDENLSPRLAARLADLYPGSVHVHQCGLGSADDTAIWEYARTNGFSIVSKDSDFQERTILLGSPPKVIWLRTNNCASEDVASVLRAAADDVQRFIDSDDETCLILS